MEPQQDSEDSNDVFFPSLPTLAVNVPFGASDDQANGLSFASQFNNPFYTQASGGHFYHQPTQMQALNYLPPAQMASFSETQAQVADWGHIRHHQTTPTSIMTPLNRHEHFQAGNILPNRARLNISGSSNPNWESEAPKNHSCKLPNYTIIDKAATAYLAQKLKKRHYWTTEERDLLLKWYKVQPYPRSEDFKLMAEKMGSDPRFVKTWFTNRRSRDRIKLKAAGEFQEDDKTVLKDAPVGSQISIETVLSVQKPPNEVTALPTARSAAISALPHSQLDTFSEAATLPVFSRVYGHFACGQQLEQGAMCSANVSQQDQLANDGGMRYETVALQKLDRNESAFHQRENAAFLQHDQPFRYSVVGALSPVSPAESPWSLPSTMSEPPGSVGSVGVLSPPDITPLVGATQQEDEAFESDLLAQQTFVSAQNTIGCTSLPSSDSQHSSERSDLSSGQQDDLDLLLDFLNDDTNGSVRDLPITPELL